MRTWGRLGGLAAGVLLIASQAFAQGVWPGGPGSTSPLVPGQLFVGLGAQVGTYNLPAFNSPWRSGDLKGLTTPTEAWPPSFSPDPTVAGPGGVFGYVFRDGTFPAWMGRKVRLSFGGQVWNGDIEDRLSQPIALRFGTLPSSAYQAAPIDGSPGTEFNLTRVSNTERTASFKVEADGFELALRLTADHAVSPRLVLSPFVSIFGGRSREAYDLRARVPGSFFDTAVYSLEERVSTTRVGALFGTGVAIAVDPRVALHFGAQAGVVWMRSHMTGQDCFSGFVSVTPGTTCGAATKGTGSFQTAVTDARSTVGFRGGLTGGVSLNLRYAVLSLTGFMTYDSQAPGIRNPYVTKQLTGQNSFSNLQTTGPARIFFDDALNYGGMIVLRIPLNAPGG